MKKSNHMKIVLAVLLELLGAVLLTVVIVAYLNGAMENRQRKASEEKLSLVSEMLTDMEETKAAETESFDQLNISKADSIALMARSVDDFAMTNEHMEQLRATIDVSNLLIIDNQGNIICSAIDNPRDYSLNRFNQLREAFGDNKSAAPFTIDGDSDSSSLRYYGSRINSQYMVIVVRDTEVLDNKLAYEASLENTLNTVHVGQDGFVCAISPLDYSFLYIPDEDLQGTNAAAAGMDVESIEDGVSDYMEINGAWYYCSTALIDDMFIVCAVPESELLNNRNTMVGIAVLIYLITVSVMILYAFFASRDSKAPQGKKEFRRYISGKLAALGVAGAIIVFGVSYYASNLFSLSRQSVTNEARLEETIQSLDDAADETVYLKDQFDESYLEKARIAAVIVRDMNSEKLTLSFMQELNTALQTSSVAYLDMDGKTIASSSDFWGYELSRNEGDQSYEFRKIYDGSVREVVQDAQLSDEGTYNQYIGVAVQDENLKTVGLVQINVTPSVLETALVSTTMGDVLSGIQTGNNGFVFAVNGETLTFDYYPDSELIGQEAVNYGLKENQLLPGFNDFIKINHTNYYSVSTDYNGEIIYVAVPMNAINNLCMPLSLVSFGFCLVWILLIWFFLSRTIHHPLEIREKSEETMRSDVNLAGSSDAIEVDRGDGKKIKTRSILSRFSFTGISWSERSAGEKVGFILKLILALVAIALLVVIVFADSIFSENSLIHYILKGSWQKGLNIFAITQCIVTVVAVLVVSVLVRRVLMWFADKMSAKGETICRLINSFIKFAVMIGLIYVCLADFGVDTSVLLTSAGILSLVVGLGANSLIKDILAGLMIVFEGAFQVGDIVTVDGFRGTVVEIGIRTTKIKEGAGNIKIFSNSDINKILNMTKDFSVVACTMSIEYGEDLRYVEKILAEEFDTIRKQLPAIKDGPFYKGVSDLGANSVDIVIVAKCEEGDRVQLDRDLRRKLKLLFDKHGINIPYPQVVINEPCTDFHHTTVRDKVEAEVFRNEQKEVSQDVFIESDGQ